MVLSSRFAIYRTGVDHSTSYEVDYSHGLDLLEQFRLGRVETYEIAACSGTRAIFRRADVSGMQLSPEI